MAQSLEELAVEVGGTALFRFRCDRSPSLPVPGVDTVRFECSAHVLTNPLGKDVPVKVRQRARVKGQATVEFAREGPLGAPWPVAVEVPIQPIADRRVGLLRVTVNERGAVEDARVALLDAAAAFGAAHVISPACFPASGKSRWTCSAVVTTPEFDPRSVPTAR